MFRKRFTPEQRQRILQAARDYAAGNYAGRGLDVVDLASDTDNYFWQGLDDRQTRIALRVIAPKRP